MLLFHFFGLRSILVGMKSEVVASRSIEFMGLGSARKLRVERQRGWAGNGNGLPERSRSHLSAGFKSVTTVLQYVAALDQTAVLK